MLVFTSSWEAVLIFKKYILSINASKNNWFKAITNAVVETSKG